MRALAGQERVFVIFAIKAIVGTNGLSALNWVFVSHARERAGAAVLKMVMPARMNH